MKKIAAALIASGSLFSTGCITSDATSLPFDVASTVGDVASSASSSGGSDNSASLQEAQAFVQSQYRWIRQDAARGTGENLAALATLLGHEQSEFSQWANEHYVTLFDDANAKQLLARIEQVAALDAI